MNEPSEMPTPVKYPTLDDVEAWDFDDEADRGFARMVAKQRDQLERDLSTLRIAAEAVADALEQQMTDVRWSIASAQVDEDSEQSLIYCADQRAKAALASLQLELAKTTPATPETPAPHPG